MKKFLIISTRRSFLIKGLIVKLEQAGFSTSYVSSESEYSDSVFDEAEYFIFYMDEAMKEDIPFLAHLADIVKKTGKMMILIGRKEERDLVNQYVPEEFIMSFYERPLDMDVFVRDLTLETSGDRNEGEKRVVLVVDDDTEYRQLIRGWLKTEYHVALANSGVQAITWLAKNQCDLVLLDYSMPVADGHKVLQMLRSEENTRDIPVMFLTGNNDKSAVMQVIDLKPEDYLLKTIGKDELLKKLRTFFAARDQEGV